MSNFVGISLNVLQFFLIVSSKFILVPYLVLHQLVSELVYRHTIYALCFSSNFLIFLMLSLKTDVYENQINCILTHLVKGQYLSINMATSFVLHCK